VSWSAGYVRLDDRTAAPHPALRERPAFVIQDVARTMRARVDEQLRESGLTWLTFSLLLVAASVDRLSQQALASKARIDRNRTSATLEDLEYEGFVARIPSPTDRRRVLVQATPAGRGLLAEAIPAIERGELEALRGLTARERARVHTLLERLVRDDRPAFLRRR